MTGLLFDIQEEMAPGIPGLSYIPNYITLDDESALIAQIDVQPWLTDLKRRVQHYGYKYDYKARAVNEDAYLGPLPNWLAPLCQNLRKEQIFAALPDQVIVNEYQPGQGISAHVDCVPCFGDTIASLSLGSSVIMQFTNPKTGQKEELYLKERMRLIGEG